MQSEFLYSYLLSPSLNNGYILIDIHVYACVYTHKHTHTHIYISHFLSIHLSMDIWLFAAVEYYSAFKHENSAICDNMNEPEVKQKNQTHKDKYYVISHTCGF